MTDPCVVLGAGGRVGRLMRGVWSATTGRTSVSYQSRSEGTGIDIVAPFDMKLSDRLNGPVGSVLVLSGATHGSATDLAKNTEHALMGLEIAKKISAPRVFVCSSAAVYRAEQDHPAFVETDRTAPVGPYGQSKCSMEKAVERWCVQTETDIQVICFRMANVIGADQLAQSVRRASNDAPLMLDQFIDGRSPRRSFLSPATLAGVIRAFANGQKEAGFQVFNLADSGPVVPMSEILTALGNHGHDIPWAWKPAPESAISEVALDTSRLRARLPNCAELAVPTSGTALVQAWLNATDGRL